MVQGKPISDAIIGNAGQEYTEIRLKGNEIGTLTGRGNFRGAEKAPIPVPALPQFFRNRPSEVNLLTRLL